MNFSSHSIALERITIEGSNFKISSGSGIDFYSTLNLHGFGYTNDSDIRLKQDVKDTEISGLDVINSMELKQFNWIESGKYEPVGVIAQQLYEVAPELIQESVDGYLQLKEGKLVYYCIKAIQELSDKIGGKKTNRTSKWKDTYELSEKQRFCKGLSKPETEIKTIQEPKAPEPIELPAGKGGK